MTSFFKPCTSVRWRLTLWYVSVLLLSSVLLGLAVDHLVARSLFTEVDRGLHETMTAFRNALDLAFLEERHPSSATLREEIAEMGVPSDNSLILILPGEPASRFNAISGLPATLEDLEPQEETGETPRTVRYSGQSWRQLSYQRVAGRNFVYRLVLFRDLSRVRAQVRLLRTSFILALIPLLLFAAATGYFLAGRVLQPVDRIAEKARQIEASELSERLPVENPRDEFGRLALVLNDLFERLQQAFQQQRKFLADAAHELRTPVAILRTR